MKERIKIQTLKDNTNTMLDISLLFQEGILHDIHCVPSCTSIFQQNDENQLDLPISPHGCFYIKFAPLHPLDDPQTII